MAEINRISGQKITLDIGGYKCSTSLQMLRAEPESMLGTMFSGRHPITKQNDGSVFIDRDGTHFRIILNYLRGGITFNEMVSDNKLLLSELLTEVNYYQLKGLEKIIKSEEKESSKVITREEILEFMVKDRWGYFFTTKALSFRNSNLNGLRLERVIFKHSLDFSGSSLRKTTFKSCCFLRNVQYSFDSTDLFWCKFEGCFVENSNRAYECWSTLTGGACIANMIRNKNMTFRNVKNIYLASFDNEVIRTVIREYYRS